MAASTNSGFHTYSSWGRTRQPKNAPELVFSENLVGNSNYIVPYADGAANGNDWNRGAESSSKGLTTENQRYMHLLLDASTIVRANKNIQIAVLGYSHAFGIWTTLLYPDKTGPSAFAFAADHTGGATGTAKHYIFEILGVDKVLLYYTSSNADDAAADHMVRVAFSTF